MQHYLSFDDQDLINDLMNDKIGIVPTDTLYGLVGKALVAPTVERIYDVRQRAPEKPLIILIESFYDLNTFFTERNDAIDAFLHDVWPGKISVILNVRDERFGYLHRGTDTLAFRMPEHPELRNLIAEVGPLVAPSANPEGQTPATTIKEAQDYFTNQVDFYFDAGELRSEPSTLVRLDHNAKPTILREGAVTLANSN